MTEQELVEFMKTVRDSLGEVKNQFVDVWTSIEKLAYVQKSLLGKLAELESRIAKLEAE